MESRMQVKAHVLEVHSINCILFGEKQENQETVATVDNNNKKKRNEGLR